MLLHDLKCVHVCTLVINLHPIRLNGLSIKCAYFTGLFNYCQFETFNAPFGRNAVVVMDTARYGGMEFGICVVKEYGYVGCFSR